jgi:uncharacterized protein
VSIGNLRPLGVITGASSGIGLELAKQFATHGYDLVVAAEDERLTVAASALRSRGADVTAVQVDLATPEGIDALHVIAGSVKNTAQVVASRVLPDRTKAAAHARFTEPQHAHADHER